MGVTRVVHSSISGTHRCRGGVFQSSSLTSAGLWGWVSTPFPHSSRKRPWSTQADPSVVVWDGVEVQAELSMRGTEHPAHDPAQGGWRGAQAPHSLGHREGTDLGSCAMAHGAVSTMLRKPRRFPLLPSVTQPRMWQSAATISAGIGGVRGRGLVCR